jgi:hypothetical protein
VFVQETEHIYQLLAFCAGQDADKDRQAHMKRQRKPVNIPYQGQVCQSPPQILTAGRSPVTAHERKKKETMPASSLRIPRRKKKEKWKISASSRASPHPIPTPSIFSTGGIQDRPTHYPNNMWLHISPQET